MRDSISKEKSFQFAVRIVRLSQFLQKEKKEFVLSQQILRSGTAIGALIREAEYGQSKADFIHKMSISLKEASETEYWILLLQETGYLSKQEAESLQFDCVEIIKILTSTIKTAKTNRLEPE